MAPLGTQQEWSYYRRELTAYRREARSWRDLLGLLQVRLALSKVGPVVCRRPVVRTVDLESTGPVSLRSHTTDVSVLGELVVGDTYQPALDAIQAPVHTIVDLGSNTGLAVRWLARHFPGAEVVCVEPEPGNVETLRANVSTLPAATVIAACVGGRRRQVTLDTSGGEFAVTMAETADVQGVTVDVITMEDVLDRAAFDHVDLLKCDIEGAERELFATCAPWIGRIDTIVVECHGDYVAGQLVAALAANGASYEIRHLDLNPGYDNEVAVLCRVPAPVHPTN